MSQASASSLALRVLGVMEVVARPTTQLRGTQDPSQDRGVLRVPVLHLQSMK